MSKDVAVFKIKLPLSIKLHLCMDDGFSKTKNEFSRKKQSCADVGSAIVLLPRKEQLKR